MRVLLEALFRSVDPDRFQQLDGAFALLYPAELFARVEPKDIARGLGVGSPETHRAQRLALQHVEGADLILTMERDHRSEVVRLSPRALRRTFTLRELARIAEVVPDEDLAFEDDNGLLENLKVLVEAAAVNRGFALPFEDPRDEDVVDPYRRSEQKYHESRDQVVTALGAVIWYLNRAAV